MQRRSGSGQPGKANRTARPQAGKAPTAPASTADRDELLDQRTRERDEALEQQAATAEILTLISSSPTNTQPVFEAIVQSGLKLFPDAAILIALPDGNKLRAAAFAEADPARAKALLSRWPVPLTREYNHAIAILDRRIIDIPDAREAPPELATGAQYFLTTGYRAITIMPMMRGGDAIGALSVVRSAPGALSEKQIAVLRTFADQAVIAIENTRLLNELRQRTDDLSESLEQQTATSEVLSVIGQSRTDVQPVFDAVAESAARLCESFDSAVWRREDDRLRLVAHHGAISQTGSESFLPLIRGSVGGRSVLDGRTVHIADIQTEGDEFPKTSENARRQGYRTILSVPLMREGIAIGAIVLRRIEARLFSERQIALLQTFADQAVIAIENVRLFEAEQARTRELSESLEQQTATSEVLQVISSSPGELEPVFNALLANATHICEAAFGNLFLREGSIFRSVAIHSTIGHADSWLRDPVLDLRDNPGVPLERVALTKQIVHIPDLRTDPSYIGKNARMVTFVEIAGARTYLVVPMLKEGEIVGTINMYRQEVRPFTDKQIELVQNFASQAVIAIENTRLLNELRESLQQQTATADVLKAISNSTTDLEPVFESIASRSVSLCGAAYGIVYRFDGELISVVAHHNLNQSALDALG